MKINSRGKTAATKLTSYITTQENSWRGQRKPCSQR